MTKYETIVPLTVRTWYVHYHGRGHRRHLTMSLPKMNSLEGHKHIYNTFYIRTYYLIALYIHDKYTSSRN